jgi:hypothetical protein
MLGGMTRRGTIRRTTRILVGVALAAVLAVTVTACGKKGGGTGSLGDGAGGGQLGDAPAGGGDVDPGASPTAAATTPPVVVVTTPADLPWPATEDCITHDPTKLAVVYNSTDDLWQVVEGGTHYMLAYKREIDAQTALAVAKRYTKHCFIGRGNTRTDRYRYIMDYYRSLSGIATVIPSPDCLTHNGDNLSIEDLGATGWRVNQGGEAIALFDTKADAQAAILVMKHYNRHCYIGRGYSGSDRLKYITDYFLTL